MTKTAEELQQLKYEVESLYKKLQDLTESELAAVVGGDLPKIEEDERYVKWTPFVDPVPIKPIVSKKCLHKPCAYSSADVCPYYSEEIGDCIY